MAIPHDLNMMSSIGRRLFVLTLLLVFLSYQRLYRLLLPYYDYFHDDRLLVDISIIETFASSKRTLSLTEKNGQDIMIQNHQQQQQQSPHKCQVKHDFFPQELIQNISNSSTFCHPTFRRNKYKCKCPNPMLPHSRVSDPSWIRTIEKNVNLTNNFFMGSSSSSFSNNNNSTTKKNLNVVFLGDSITRGWHWDDTKQEIFHKHFGNDSLALGVARDTTSNLLHRIRDNSTNGELTSILNNPPKVWWILIGINNLGKSTLCSREATLAGILQIVADLRNLSQPTNQQQQQQQRLTSDVSDGGNRSGYNNVNTGPIIVLNSILPKSKFPNGRVGDDWKQRVPWINRRLECFAEMTPGVEYFDSTNLFLMKSNHKRIDMKLLPDKVHPSSHGYEVWGKSISKKLSQLL